MMKKTQAKHYIKDAAVIARVSLSFALAFSIALTPGSAETLSKPSQDVVPQIESFDFASRSPADEGGKKLTAAEAETDANRAYDEYEGRRDHVQRITNANPSSKQIPALKENLVYMAEIVFEKTVKAIELRQNEGAKDADLETLRNRAATLASTLRESFSNEITTLARDLKNHAASADGLRRRGQPGLPMDVLGAQIRDQMDKAHKVALKLEDFDRRAGHLTAALINSKIPISAEMLRDPSLSHTRENIINLGFEFEPTSKEQLRLEAPSNMRYLLAQGPRGKIGQAGLHFGTTYLSFSLAMSMIAIAQWGMNYRNNPIGIEQLAHMGEPSAMVGFGIFMLASHPVSRLLNGVMAGTVPKTMIPYVGMVVGSLASSMFHDVYTDKDVHKCVKSWWAGKKDVEACDKAWDTWGATRKIMQYAPSLMSMLGSMAMATAIRAEINKGVKSINTMRIAVTGGVLVHGANANKSLGPAAKAVHAYRAAKLAKAGAIIVLAGVTPLGFAIAVGDFVLFLGLDMMIAEPINYYWQGYRISSFNPEAWLDRNGFHKEFRFPKPGQRQAIANAFDVEATTFKSAHGYVMDMFQTHAATGWKRPADPKTCAPKDLPDPSVPVPIDPALMAMFGPEAMWGYNEMMHVPMGKKSREQLRCEVLARPKELLQKYAKINVDWRTHLLSKFAAGQANWLKKVDRFNSVYNATMVIGKYIADEKWKVVQGQKEKPDLSREALLKLIPKPEKPADAAANAEEEVKAHPSRFLNVMTPELLDYVVAGLACGTKNADPVASTNPLDDLDVDGKDRVVENNYITTPFGASFDFKPPNITVDDGTICRMVRRQRIIVNPDKIEEPVQFTTQARMTGPDGKVYTNLAEYIFDRMNPAVYKSPTEFSNFPTWWTEMVTNSIQPVWREYEKEYRKLAQEKFIPPMFEKSFFAGCPTPGPVTATNTYKNLPENHPLFEKGATTATDGHGMLTQTGADNPRTKQAQRCRDDSNAYRAANGVFQAMEVEIRNYLRGLYSISTAIITQGFTQKEIQAKLLMERARQKQQSSTDTKPPKSEDLIVANLKNTLTPTEAFIATHAFARTEFMKLSNELITHFRTPRPEDLTPEAMKTRAEAARVTMKALADLLVAQANAARLESTDYRVETMGQLVSQMEAVVTEAQKYGDVLEALSFEASVSRPAGQTLHTRPALSPLNRTGK